MTFDEALAAVEEAKLKAHAAARKLLPAGPAGQTSTIVNAARMIVMEALLAELNAQHSKYVESTLVKTVLELRDYWDCVAEEIAK